MTICNVPGCDEHYGCRIKNKGVQVSVRVLPVHGGNWKPSRPTPPNKRRGEIMYDERPGGVKMPIMKPDGSHLRRHEYERRRREVTTILRSHNAENAAAAARAQGSPT